MYRVVSWMFGIPIGLALASWAVSTKAQEGGERRQPFKLELNAAAYADRHVDGSTNEGWFVAPKLDAKLKFDGGAAGLWEGFAVNAHFEYVDGDDVNEANDGVIFPVNTATALPRGAGKNTTVSLTASQALGKNVTVTGGKFNVVAAADGAPLVGGNGRGGFNYVGIAAPPSFVFPPYVFGGQLSVTTKPVNFSFFVYDSRTAIGSDFWDDPFKDPVYNGSATFKTNFGNRPGFYTINLIHSTAEGLDFKSLLFEPNTAGFATQKKGFNYGAFKFQQFLHVDQANPGKGWGLFGQIGIGDDNPLPLGKSYLIGVGGNSPLNGRSDDRWGIAYSKYSWSDDLIAGLATIGTAIEAETVIEAFYEAALTNNLRLGANIMHIDPGTVGFDDSLLVGGRVRYVR